MKAPLSKRKVLKPDPLKNTRSPCCCEHDPGIQSGDLVGNGGFYPGWFWSPLLAVMQFFGGMAIAAGVFTRPIALANGVMLGITWWFHYTHPYDDAFLTQAGIEALAAGGQDLFTPEGLQRLANGGGAFLTQVQHKAEFLSAIWTAGVLLFAGYGGGSPSVDRMLRKEF